MSGCAPCTVIGPTGRRILRLVASPDGRTLGCLHVPQTYASDDHHWAFFRRDGADWATLGTLPCRAKAGSGEAVSRSHAVALDDGAIVVIENARSGLSLARYEAAAAGLGAVACWPMGPEDTATESALRLLPSGRDALLFRTSVFEEHSDWTGGLPPTYYHHWRLVDLATGAVREEATMSKTGEEPLDAEIVTGSRGTAVVAALTGLPWLDARPAAEREARRRQIEALAAATPGSPIRFGERCFLTGRRAVAIATGETLVEAFNDPNADRFGSPPRLHDLSPDEDYVAATGKGGHFELWSVATRTAWRPELPAHGGVHTAIFLPGGTTALGTAAGGIVIFDRS